MAKKTKAAIKFTLTLTASAEPNDYSDIVAAVGRAEDLLLPIGTVILTGPTIVRVEV